MKKILYVHTIKGQIIAYQIEPKKIYVGQEDLHELLEAIDELGETIRTYIKKVSICRQAVADRQSEADDWADNGFDDGEGDECDGTCIDCDEECE